MEIIEYKRCKPRDTHQYLTWAIDPGIDGAKHPPAKRGVERYLTVYLDIDGSDWISAQMDLNRLLLSQDLSRQF